jgi:hypothetical protein
VASSASRDLGLRLAWTVDLDFINIWGMPPSIGVGYETTASNDPLGRYNRVTALVGTGKAF